MSTNFELRNLFSVNGKVIVVTGGGTGIGANIALALDANGAKSVYILGRRQNVLEETAAKAKNGTVKPLVADVSSKDSLDAARDAVASAEGYVDLLIANSGVTGPNGGLDKLFANGQTPSINAVQESLEGVAMQDFTDTFHVNVTGAFYTAISFLGLLDAANKRRTTHDPTAQIIITTSTSGFSRSAYVGFAYSASKAAANHLVKLLSSALAPYKIRCNGIAPGFFLSEMTDGRWGGPDQDPRVEGSLPATTVPLQRTGTEEDIAGLALFLAAKAGSYVNGSIHVIDGGRIGISPSTY